MNTKVISKLENYCSAIENSSSYKVSNYANRKGIKSIIPNCPQKGVYIFFLNQNPMYIGQSQNLHRRIIEYVKINSRPQDNPFIVNITKCEVLIKNLNIDIHRSIFELQNDETFKSIFQKNLQEFHNSYEIKVIEIDCLTDQKLFESYYTLKRTTKYNDINYSILGIYGAI